MCCTDRRRDAPRRLLSVSLGRANVVSFVCGLQVILREIVSEFLRIPRTFKLVQRGVSVCSLVRPTAILQLRPNCLFCIPVYLVCHHTFAESARADLRNSLREVYAENLWPIASWLQNSSTMHEYPMSLHGALWQELLAICKTC